jgi:hypothetical protein
MKTEETKPATLKVKVTLPITKDEVIEKEITLPYYTKDKYHLYKITGEDECIRVSVWGDGKYSISNFIGFTDALRATECTGAEFEAELIIAKSII